MNNRELYNEIYTKNNKYNHNVMCKFQHILDFVKGEKGQILDAGCGEGWSLMNLLEKGYNVKGIEISDVCF